MKRHPKRIPFDLNLRDKCVDFKIVRQRSNVDRQEIQMLSSVTQRGANKEGDNVKVVVRCRYDVLSVKTNAIYVT